MSTWNFSVVTVNSVVLLRVKGQNPLHQFPRSKSTQSANKDSYNKLATSWQLPWLRRSYGDTCLMDFGHNGASNLTSRQSFYCSASVPLCVSFFLLVFVMTAKISVREYVFYVFFQISKKRLFRFFWNDVLKVVKSHRKSIKFAECL